MEKSWSVFANTSQMKFEFLKNFKTPPLVLCVGSNLFVEDCLGPLVGSLLKQYGYQNEVFGDMESPITSKNLALTQKFLKSVYPQKQILMIDASTSTQSTRIGTIVLKNEYVAFNPILKNENICFDWFLFGICSHTTNIFPQMFQSKMSVVEKLAKTICLALLSLNNRPQPNFFNPTH